MYSMLQSEKLNNLVQKLERENISEKPWRLRGEIDAKSRPTESLLEANLVFDHGPVTVPTITAEFTQRVEALILRRVKDRAWDDVERKMTVSENIRAKIKPVNTEKSKLGLAEVYEQSYIKAANKTKSAEETKEIAEIRKELHATIRLLDALTNQKFTPDIIAPPVKVVKNEPALNLEEIIPIHASDHQTLAPQEVSRPANKLPMAPSEMDRTDKNNIRRKKKVFQRKKYEAIERKKEQKELVDSKTVGKNKFQANKNPRNRNKT